MVRINQLINIYAGTSSHSCHRLFRYDNEDVTKAKPVYVLWTSITEVQPNVPCMHLVDGINNETDETYTVIEANGRFYVTDESAESFADRVSQLAKVV